MKLKKILALAIIGILAVTLTGFAAPKADKAAPKAKPTPKVESKATPKGEAKEAPKPTQKTTTGSAVTKPSWKNTTGSAVTSPSSIDVNKKVENPLKVGKSNTAKVNDVFSIILDDKATDSFKWTYSVNNTKAIKLVEQYIQPGASGAAGKQIFVFKALKQGTYKLRFTYAKPGDKKTPPAKAIEYSVKIK